MQRKGRFIARFPILGLLDAKTAAGDFVLDANLSRSATEFVMNTTGRLMVSAAGVIVEQCDVVVRGPPPVRRQAYREDWPQDR